LKRGRAQLAGRHSSVELASYVESRFTKPIAHGFTMSPNYWNFAKKGETVIQQQIGRELTQKQIKLLSINELDRNLLRPKCYNLMTFSVNY
jgi:hypothetical protein